jgi:hypothetical protein
LRFSHWTETLPTLRWPMERGVRRAERQRLDQEDHDASAHAACGLLHVGRLLGPVPSFHKVIAADLDPFATQNEKYSRPPLPVLHQNL